jgi:glycine/D-amino acid oxidase-like deaminating enzyme
MTTNDFLMSPQQQPVDSYLSAMTEPRPDCPPLGGDVQVDVAIVGGGYTGLSAALALASRKLSVRVLEARHVGWGGSGRAWGQVAAFAKFMPAKVEQDFGADIGGRINEAAAQGPDLVFDLIRNHVMRCSESRTGNLLAAHTPAKEAGIIDTVKNLQGRGLPVELLTGEEAQRFIGSKRYSVALYDPRGGALNPLGYAYGLARAAIEAGALVHGATPVSSVERAGSGWRLSTPGGTVTAGAVILATNAFGSDNLFPGMRRAVMPVRAYQMISEPLSEAALATVLPGKQPINDTRKLFSGVRLWPDGRLQVGADGPAFDPQGRPDAESTSRRVTMMFPELAGLKWETGWGGWVDMAEDEYPRIHGLAPGLWAGFGFSGRGIAIGTIMGRDLAALAAGGSQKDVVHPISPLRPLWYHALHRPLIGALLRWYWVVDRWNDARFGRGTGRGAS